MRHLLLRGESSRSAACIIFYALALNLQREEAGSPRSRLLLSTQEPFSLNGHVENDKPAKGHSTDPAFNDERTTVEERSTKQAPALVKAVEAPVPADGDNRRTMIGRAAIVLPAAKSILSEPITTPNLTPTTQEGATEIRPTERPTEIRSTVPEPEDAAPLSDSTASQPEFDDAQNTLTSQPPAAVIAAVEDDDVPPRNSSKGWVVILLLLLIAGGSGAAFWKVRAKRRAGTAADAPVPVKVEAPKAEAKKEEPKVEAKKEELKVAAPPPKEEPKTAPKAEAKAAPTKEEKPKAAPAPKVETPVAAKKPAAEKHATDKPVAGKPVAGKPAAEKKTVVEKKVEAKPAAKKKSTKPAPAPELPAARGFRPD